MTQRQKIAEAILGEIEWDDSELGYCECPSVETHSTEDGKRACRVTLDGTATIFCFHQSCLGIIAGLNRKLRTDIASEELSATVPPQSAEKMRLRERERRRKKLERERRDKIVQECFSENRESILERFAWSECEAVNASPIDFLKAGSSEGQLLLKTLFNESDVLWMGEKWDSGKPAMKRHFQTVAAWLSKSEINTPYICPATFKTGSYRRSAENTVTRPYIVFDGDSVDPICAEKLRRKENLTENDKARNRLACLAVINFFRIHSAFALRALVDSGSKSIHGWFDAPDSEELNELKVILPALGFDPSVLRLSQPVRFPGVFRKDSNRWQKLLYLSA
jgi:hypothetical protein